MHRSVFSDFSEQACHLVIEFSVTGSESREYTITMLVPDFRLMLSWKKQLGLTCFG